MNETNTAIVMIAIFCFIGVGLPVFLMVRDKTQQSSLPNKLILWITMVFCMMLVFGIVVDFRTLSEAIRGDIIKYGFIAIMLFGVIFGIDQLLKSRNVRTVKWKDLTVETRETASVEPVSAEHASVEPEPEEGDNEKSEA